MQVLQAKSDAYNVFAMSNWTNLWDMVRSEIEHGLEERGWSRAELSRRTAIGTTTLNAFLNGQNKTMEAARLDAIESALGRALLSPSIRIGAARGSGHDDATRPPVRFCPVVFPDRLPPVSIQANDQGAIMDALRGAAHDWAESSSGDENVFFFELREAMLGFCAGERIFFSRSLASQDGDTVACVAGGVTTIGEYISDGDYKRVRTAKDGTVKDFQILGIATEARRSLLNRRA